MAQPQSAPRYDVVVVGAGFAGLYALYRLRSMGLRVQGLEAAEDVGGTWYWNRYPGARCDVESMSYSYSFSPQLEKEWVWSERYASQPEILSYLQHVAERFELRDLIRFRTRLTRARYDETGHRWELITDGGEALTARFVIMATGCLSQPRLPPIPGLSRFGGRILQTAAWPHEAVDFAGQRVGVIGTGSSGIQTIPVIAAQAAQLTVFQRTPNFSVPARNHPLDPAARQALMGNYPPFREELRTSFTSLGADAPMPRAAELTAEQRRQLFAEHWRQGGIGILFSLADLITDRGANETLAGYFHDRIRELVRDRAVADQLLPRDFPIGTKRLCVDTDYYTTFNRTNVELINLRETPLVEVTPAGVRTTDREIPLDSLVFATGFDAVTGALLAVDIRGRGAQTLADAWATGPRSYLGLMVAGFPNLFTITGPGSPSVLSNMVVSIEQHVEFISDLIGQLGVRGARTVEAQPQAQAAWVEHVHEVAQGTLYPLADSWYMGANIPGKPRVFLPYVGGVGPYRTRCAAIAAQGYPGFAIGA